MDNEAAAFVVDRIDMARMALKEARQTVEKFAQQEDSDVAQSLDELLKQLNDVDGRVRNRSHTAG